MKISKLLAWSFILMFLLGVNIVLAKDAPEGTPFKAVWESIEGLQEQIDVLSVGGINEDSFYVKECGPFVTDSSEAIGEEVCSCANNDIAISGSPYAGDGSNDFYILMENGPGDSQQDWVATILAVLLGGEVDWSIKVKCLELP